MRKKPVRLTDEANALLVREAERRAGQMSIKQIAHVIGASRSYVQSHLARLVCEIERPKVVPRGTFERKERGDVSPSA